MGILDRILGNNASPPQRSARNIAPPVNADARAVERYRYMLQTAPPETIEEAHAEAFAKLSPEQRRLALQTLAEAAPPQEKAAVAATSPDDPQAMGRLATRAEVRQPGFLERSFGGGGGMGLGGSLLTSFAAGFVGSMVAQSFFSSMDGGGFGGSEEADAAGDVDGTVDGTDNTAADVDQNVGDVGGEDFGGDVGGGDFDI